MNPLIIIPARMASTRLPGKPLADIHGKPMIVHVMERAKAANCGPVYVACCEDEVFEMVTEHGGKAVMTKIDHPSGSDRVRAAADRVDPAGNFDVIVNVQGDTPGLDPAVISNVVAVLEREPTCDIATAVVETTDEGEKADPNVVKAVMGQSNRALYFSRAAIPTGHGPVWHHVGIYAYRRDALNRFCDLEPSFLEERERLEQLRALEAGMSIFVEMIDSAPVGVDTPEDLERVRAVMGGKHE